MSRLKFFDTPIETGHEPEKISFEPILGKQSYQIEVFQEMMVNDRSFVNTLTTIEWAFKIEEITTKNYKVTLDTTSYEIGQTSEVNKAITDFGLLFNFPVRSLHLLISHSGEIMSVLNQADIFEKWQNIKQTDLLSFQNDKSMEGIFVAGDTEFSNTISILSRNPLYLIFFDVVYGNLEKIGNVGRKGIILNSRLFQGNLVELANSRKLSKKGEVISIENTYRSDSDSDATLKEQYQKDFKGTTGANFVYSYKLQSLSEYSFDDGMLLKSTAVCAEEANENLIHTTKYTIKLSE